ncbi:MAG: hypothetical protein M1812_005362 [Candelaria pacifica]|nr:MAG: hypothetical protein M1812_005362 [Candelaria pacifica]
MDLGRRYSERRSHGSVRSLASSNVVSSQLAWAGESNRHWEYRQSNGDWEDPTTNSDDEVPPSTNTNRSDSSIAEEPSSEESDHVSNSIEHQELLKGVKRFAEEYKLQDSLDFLQTGALLSDDASIAPRIQELKEAQPDIYGSVHTPTEAELAALEDEKHNIWHHKREIPKTIILGSIAAAVQGWDQTGSNGANIWFPQDLGIPPTPPSTSGTPSGTPGPNDWKIGLINAAPAFAHKWYELFNCRLLLGIGMGVKATTVPIYMAEISPKRIRGALVMSWQTCVAFGTVLGFSANLAVYKTGKIAWRLQFGSAFLPALPLLVGIFWCPESPRWYMKKNRYGDALKSLQRLRTTKLQAARDVYYIYRQLVGEVALQQNNSGTTSGITHLTTAATIRSTRTQTPLGLRSYFTRFRELFVKNRVRQATIAAATVMVAQQACGINIISFYSSTIFITTGGASNYNALWCSWGFGLCNFIFAFPALFTIDRWGRRTLLLYTFPQLAWTLLAAGLCSLVRNEDAVKKMGLIPSQAEKAKLGLVTFFIFLYTAFYSAGEGPVPFTYSAEVFPLSHRELGMSFAVSVNLTFAAILSLTFPSMVTAFDTIGAFGFYACLNVASFILIFFLMPETTRRTLEDLDHVFERPVREFAADALGGIRRRKKPTDIEMMLGDFRPRHHRRTTSSNVYGEGGV